MLFLSIFKFQSVFYVKLTYFFQGEMVDRIEENIKSSHNYVEKAVADTAAAVQTSKKVRKVSKFKVMSLGGHL